MNVIEHASGDINTHGGGERPPSTGLTPDVLPEVQKPVLAENSQTGVSPRNALSRNDGKPTGEKTSHKAIYVSSVITSIAAMLVIGFFLFRNAPEGSVPIAMVSAVSSSRYTEYTEFSMLIEKEDYARAFAYIEKAENFVVSISSSLEKPIMANNDSKSMNLYELKWLKVQVFVGLDRTDEAKSVLQEIKNIEGKYYNEIDSLWNKLQYLK